MENQTPRTPRTKNVFFGQTRQADQTRLRKRIKPTAKIGHNRGLIAEIDGATYAGGVPPLEVRQEWEKAAAAKKAAKPANFTFNGKGYPSLKAVANAARKGEDGQFTAKAKGGEFITIRVIGTFVAIKREGCAWQNA